MWANLTANPQCKLKQLIKAQFSKDKQTTKKSNGNQLVTNVYETLENSYFVFSCILFVNFGHYLVTRWIKITIFAPTNKH